MSPTTFTEQSYSPVYSYDKMNICMDRSRKSPRSSFRKKARRAKQSTKCCSNCGKIITKGNARMPKEYTTIKDNTKQTSGQDSSCKCNVQIRIHYRNGRERIGAPPNYTQFIINDKSFYSDSTHVSETTGESLMDITNFMIDTVNDSADSFKSFIDNDFENVYAESRLDQLSLFSHDKLVEEFSSLEQHYDSLQTSIHLTEKTNSTYDVNNNDVNGVSILSELERLQKENLSLRVVRNRSAVPDGPLGQATDWEVSCDTVAVWGLVFSQLSLDVISALIFMNEFIKNMRIYIQYLSPCTMHLKIKL